MNFKRRGEGLRESVITILRPPMICCGLIVRDETRINGLYVYICKPHILNWLCASENAVGVD